MNKRRKTIVILLMLVVLITILRETNVITLDYYFSKSEIKIERNLGKQTIETDLPTSFQINASTQTNLSDIPIIVVCDGEEVYKKTGKGLPVTINISNIDIAGIWVPLYKSGQLYVTAPVNYGISMVKPTSHEHGLKSITGSISGQISLSVNITIKGFCSHYTAKKIINRMVAEKLASDIQQYFSSLD